MIIGIGLDVTEIERFDRLLKKHGRALLEKILTPSEISVLPKQAVPFLAGRFAAKEATVKALGTGFTGGIGTHDIEILPNSLGRPILRLRDAAAEAARRLGVARQHVTISHGRQTVAAVVIMESE